MEYLIDSSRIFETHEIRGPEIANFYQSNISKQFLPIVPNSIKCVSRMAFVGRHRISPAECVLDNHSDNNKKLNILSNPP